MSKPSEHRARKRFGQNFLHDHGIINRIVRAIAPKPDDQLVEIGPGQGAITEELLHSGCQLDVIELDRDLAPILLEKFAGLDNFRLHQGDALRFDFSKLSNDKPLRVVGNLPYNISTPLIFHLLSQQALIGDMHFMLQKEVVDRLAAEPGNKAWGRLGIMAQYYCRVESLFEVPPECFNPRPKVQSAIVRLIPHRQLPHPAEDVATLQRVLREAFNQRRKTLRNNLKNLISAEQLEAIGLNPGERPEKLSLADFVAIANATAANQQQQKDQES